MDLETAIKALQGAKLSKRAAEAVSVLIAHAEGEWLSRPPSAHELIMRTFCRVRIDGHEEMRSILGVAELIKTRPDVLWQAKKTVPTPGILTDKVKALPRLAGCVELAAVIAVLEDR